MQEGGREREDGEGGGNRSRVGIFYYRYELELFVAIGIDVFTVFFQGLRRGIGRTKDSIIFFNKADGVKFTSSVRRFSEIVFGGLYVRKDGFQQIFFRVVGVIVRFVCFIVFFLKFRYKYDVYIFFFYEFFFIESRYYNYLGVSRVRVNARYFGFLLLMFVIQFLRYQGVDIISNRYWW